MNLKNFVVPIENEVADLIRMRKIVESGRLQYDAPQSGCRLDVPLVSPEDRYTKFTFSVYEGRRRPSVTVEMTVDRKTTLQTRKDSLPLVRIDLDPKAEHTNPDGTKVRGSHLHIANDRYGNRWAVSLSTQSVIDGIRTYDMPSEVFEPFKRFCNIDEALAIAWTLGCEV